MRTVYFVDDDTSVLSGLRRMMRDLRDEWQTECFDDPQQAIDRMLQQQPDVLVTDMRMPRMDGADLLEVVKARWPRTIRMVLSGQAEFEKLSRVMTTAHQVLSKPCDPELFRATLRGLAPLCEQGGFETVAEAVAGIGALPAIPSVVHELVAELDQPEFDVERLTAMIELDPGIRVKVMQVANSGYFGARSRITDVAQAVVMLGVRMLKTLIFDIKIVEAFPVESSSFSPSIFAHRVELIGQIATRIAGGRDGRAIYSMARTNDVGQLILASRMPEAYEDVLRTHREGSESLQSIERRILGVDHTVVGAFLLGLWGMDAEQIQNVARHHTPGESSQPELLTTLCIAEALVDSAGDSERFRALLSADLPTHIYIEEPPQELLAHVQTACS